MADIGAEYLIRRLRSVADVPAVVVDALLALRWEHAAFRPGETIYLPGAMPDQFLIVVEGSVCRYKVTYTGAQSVLSFELAGDLVNTENLALVTSDCGARAVGDVRIACVERAAFEALIDEHEELDAILRRYILVRAATLEEWLLNVGQRPGRERLAHVLTEITLRAAVVGIPWHDVSPLIPGVDDLANATGQATVQVTRAFRDLLTEGAIGVHGDRHVILDVGRLRRLGRFDARYLHLAGEA